MSIQNNKIFLTPWGVKLWTKNVKYDKLSLSSNKRSFSKVNFLINAAFEHVRMRRLFHFSLPKCGVYWRAAFKRGNTVLKVFLTVS